MSNSIPITSVMWHFNGYEEDEPHNLFHSYEWNQLSKINSSACEYAYQNSINLVSTHDGLYIFDLKNKIMYLGFNDNIINHYIPIKRSV